MNKKLALLFLFLIACPFLVNAEVSKFVFTSEPQNIKPDQISEVLSIQAQDASGTSNNTTQTTCLEIKTTSSSGEFSSSNTNWTSVTVLTMNKGSANRNFYYKDSSSGTFSLTAKAVPRPEAETRPCASWPVNEWGTGLTARQDIVVSNNAPAVVQEETTAVESVDSAGISGVGIQFSEQKIYANAGADKIITAGAEEKFIGEALGFKKEPLEGGRYLWSFGDGSTSEKREAVHTYKYSGEYIAVFKAIYYNYSAVDRIIVKVIDSQITISEVNDEFIKISNSADTEVNISDWMFRFGGLNFRLPESTIIKAGGILIIPNSVSNLKIGSKNDSVELLYPNGLVAGAYNGSELIAKDLVVNSVTNLKTAVIKKAPAIVSTDAQLSTASVELAPIQNLASVIYAEQKDTDNSNKWLLSTAGVGLLAAIGYASVKRQKREIILAEPGDNFTIEEDKF